MGKLHNSSNRLLRVAFKKKMMSSKLVYSDFVSMFRTFIPNKTRANTSVVTREKTQSKTDQTKQMIKTFTHTWCVF